MSLVTNLPGKTLIPVAMISGVALKAWISLTFAVEMCSMLCGILAAIVTTVEIYKGTWRPSIASHKDIMFALPRLWIHWQLRYLSGAPIILVVTLLYAQHLGFDRLAAV